jgi:ATP-dependent DNA helicase RecQ
MEALLEVIRRTWGHAGFRPLQREAMRASLEGRDALVVLPTGGGKSLCYQAPALLAGGLTVVVSPLISLMKDQVDRLAARGVRAASLHSGMGLEERGRILALAVRGGCRFLFVAPERFSSGGFEGVLGRAGVRAFAIDEAHCISHWGHDFRAEYRALGRLKRAFPGVPVHAFTATATPRVRADIVGQLGLRDPEVLVGDFFRPNLRLRVARRRDPFEDALREVRRRPGQAGIVYALRRAEVDRLAGRLRESGVRAVAYHAGMGAAARAEAQDRWGRGEADVVAATVAFGMGIDRADVRFVVHAGMPQSLEHYQQQAGRAGRDGRPADCVMFHSRDDLRLWLGLIDAQGSPDAPNKRRQAYDMDRFCVGARCRHRALVEHFGQAWKGGACGACDLCGGAPSLSRPGRGLYERLRDVRRSIADGRGVPASEIMSDSVLRELERRRPSTMEELRGMRGIDPGVSIIWGWKVLRAMGSGGPEVTQGNAPGCDSMGRIR